MARNWFVGMLVLPMPRVLVLLSVFKQVVYSNARRASIVEFIFKPLAPFPLFILISTTDSGGLY